MESGDRPKEKKPHEVIHDLQKELLQAIIDMTTGQTSQEYWTAHGIGMSGRKTPDGVSKIQQVIKTDISLKIKGKYDISTLPPEEIERVLGKIYKIAKQKYEKSDSVESPSPQNQLYKDICLAYESAIKAKRFSDNSTIQATITMVKDRIKSINNLEKFKKNIENPVLSAIYGSVYDSVWIGKKKPGLFGSNIPDDIAKMRKIFLNSKLSEEEQLKAIRNIADKGTQGKRANEDTLENKFFSSICLACKNSQMGMNSSEVSALTAIEAVKNPTAALNAHRASIEYFQNQSLMILNKYVNRNKKTPEQKKIQELIGKISRVKNNKNANEQHNEVLNILASIESFAVLNKKLKNEIKALHTQLTSIDLNLTQERSKRLDTL